MKLDTTQRILLGACLIAGAAFSAYTVSTVQKPAPAPQVGPAPTASSDSGTKDVTPPVQVVGTYFEKTFVVRVGAYQDFMWGGTKIRVDVREIAKQNVPSRYGSPKEEQQATIHVDTGGGLVYGGEESTRVGVNEYRIPVATDTYEEPRAVYLFSISPSYFRFLCFRADHINPTTNEVTLKASFVSSQK